MWEWSSIVNRQEFKKAIVLDLRAALECSVEWKGFEEHPKQPNAYRSAYFCYQVGEHLDSTIGKRFPGKSIERRQIRFVENDEKETGEWLLDILWCDEVQPDPKSKFTHPSKVYAAVECESSTYGKDFFEDFAKLVHVKSDIKIFLAGVDQVRETVMCDYIVRRKRQAAQFLSECSTDYGAQEWYLAFWPSPKDGKWESLDSYSHLNEVRVFEL